MIAEKCCGSCDEYWSMGCSIESNINDFGYADCCDKYSPRNPIKSKYEKVLDELKSDLSSKDFSKFSTKESLFKYIKYLEEKHEL